MPIAIQGGETQARLRRLLAVDAGLALSLDEVISPVSIVGDASTAPFRTNGRAWTHIPIATSVVAAQFSYLSLAVTEPGLILMVEGFRVLSLVAAQDFAVWTDGLAFSGVGAVACLDLETPRAAGIQHSGFGARINTGNAAATPGGAEVWRGGQVGITNTVEQRFPNPIRIDGKTDMIMIIQGRTLATAYVAQFFGKYFQA